MSEQSEIKSEIKLNLKSSLHSWEDLINYQESPEPGQVDANVFPGLGPVAEAMHASIFGSRLDPATKRMAAEQAAVAQASRNLPADIDRAAAQLDGDVAMWSFGMGLSGEPFVTPHEANKRAMKIARAARQTQIIATFKSRLERTWHLFATIPETISAIWTTPPMTAEQALAHSVDGVSRAQRMQEMLSMGLEQYSPGRSSAFCTPSRPNLTGR